MKKTFLTCRLPTEVPESITRFLESWDYWPVPEVLEALSTGNYTLHALFLDEICAGVLLNFKAGESVDIIYIWTDPGLRRQGLALQLLMECERTLKQEGEVTKIFLEVRSDNNAAQRLYESFQMKLINIRKNYYNDSCDAFVYVKELG